jgi:DAPG hydrolase PhiG domain
MRFNEVNRLLDPAPMPLEMGFERLEDGVAHVAARTDMHGCTGKMFEWWFRFKPDTQQYSWWHPLDHGPSHWANTTDGTHIGSEHIIEESFGEIPSEPLIIQFRDPSEFFDMKLFHAALENKSISGAVLGRIGFGHQPPRLPTGEVLGGRLLHIPRDTPWGCVLRSHFFVGQDLPATGASPQDVIATVKDAFMPTLMRHAYEEFTFLSRFLPSLYAAENRKLEPAQSPW